MADKGEFEELEEEEVLKMGDNLGKIEKVVCKGGEDETKNSVGDS